MFQFNLLCAHCQNSHITIAFLSCFVSVVLWLVVIELGIFPHVKRGFYCDDRTINMRYNGETVTSAAIILSIFLVYPILWICEACYFVPVSLKSSRCAESARRAWKWFKEYMFGIVLHLFVVDGLKVSTDRIFFRIKPKSRFFRKSLTKILIGRFYSVSFDHISSTLVARMLCKLVPEGEQHKFEFSYSNNWHTAINQ